MAHESPSTTTQITVSSTEIKSQVVHDFITIDGVEISPGSMIFDNAYEGKLFKQKLTIHNKGKFLAFVRMCKPTSQAYAIQVFPKGRLLSPGLKVTRTVKYLFNRLLAVPTAFMPICINETWLDYKFFVNQAMPVISVEPQQLDFGKIDALNTATTLTLDIINSGYKGTLFAIDLGKNELGINVEPIRGIVHARSAVTLSVEIFSSKEGEFSQEFWIKTSPPVRVIITVNFISPKLTIEKFYNKFDFTLIDFPRTYYGARRSVPFFIKNESSSNSMFLVVAEVQGKKISLEEASEKSADFRNFFVHPMDGRLYSERGSVIHITFAPQLQKEQKVQKTYCACFVRVIRLHCRDVDYNVFQDVFTSHWEQSIRESIIAMTSETNDLNAEPVAKKGHEDYDDEMISTMYEEYSIRLCLHGEQEEAKVLIRPDLVVLTDLEFNKTIDRVLYIENGSHCLPITVKYEKVPSIEVYPNKITLKAGGGMEVKLSIRPQKFGKMARTIVFTLTANDSPVKHSVVSRVVGCTKVNIEVSASFLAPQKRMQKCCAQVDLEQLNLPQERQYKLTGMEQKLKMFSKNYYTDYLRRRNLQRQEEAKKSLVVSDYDLTNRQSLLQKQVSCQIRKAIVQDIVEPFSPFIPLTPRQLYYICIYPKYIKLKRIAAATSINEYFILENRNNFPIRVFHNPSKDCITFGGDPRAIVKAHEKRKINFYFSSVSTGVYNVSLDIIINESHIFQIAILGQVVAMSVKIDRETVTFSKDEEIYQYVKIINELNVPSIFTWQVPSSCFKVYPKSGYVPADRSILCLVSYYPNPNNVHTTEVELQTECGGRQVLTFIHIPTKYAVELNPNILNIGKIPLNIPVYKEVIMTNLEKEPMAFFVEEASPFPGLTIHPNKGTLPAMRSQSFEIKCQIKALISFSIEAVFIINQERRVELKIEGEVECPNITTKPNYLNLRKINPYSFDKAAFVVENQSDCECFIDFPVDDFPEFTITSNDENHLPHEDHLTLMPKEAKLLFLHFHPCHITTYALSLPIVVNGIIGPPRISERASSKIENHLRQYTMDFDDIEGVRFKQTSKNVPMLNVTCCAVEKKVEISDFSVNLLYFGPDHPKNELAKDFEITNVTELPVRICVRTDDLNEPFTLTPKDIENLETYDVSYTCTIQPKETVTFQVEFLPNELGKYVQRLPIFLRQSKDDKVFNYLTLIGTYEYPQISCSHQIIHLLPVPTMTTNEFEVILSKTNHYPKCVMSFMSNKHEIQAKFQKRTDSEKVVVVLGVTSKSPLCYDGSVCFSCSCGSSCEVLLKGAVERCILTSHFAMHEIKAKLAKPRKSISLNSLRLQSSTAMVVNDPCRDFINKNHSCFPYFPTPSDTSPYAIHQHSIAKTLERWVYTQGFGCAKYHRIPEDFVHYPEIKIEALKPMRGKKQAKPLDLPIVQLLLNLTGKSVRSSLVTTTSCSNDMTKEDKVSQCYTTNSNVLRFLRSYSAYLPNVSAKYLLSYDHYVIYKKFRSEGDRIDSREEFHLLSKQCWVDVILQIIKVLVVNRIEMATEPLDLWPTEHGYLEKALFHERELYLLQWMEEIFNEDRTTLWTKERPPDEKIVRFFVGDMRDGLLLGAITVRFCPYVKSYIEDMFTSPTTPEEYFHNACRLKQAWQELNFSFEFEPCEMASATLMDMFLLVVYLYEILPACQPKETLTIEVLLTERDHIKIDVKNCGASPSYYRPIFFNNAEGLFTIERDIIQIAPKQSTTVKITYYAKKMSSSHVYLLLSGEIPGHKYSKSLAFELHGVSKPHYVDELYIESEMYQLKNFKFPLQSPHKMAARYSLYYAFKLTCDMNELMSYEAEESQVMDTCPAKETSAVFDDMGHRVVDMMVCALSLTAIQGWIYYINSEVGDFSVKLTVKGTLPKSNDCYEDIEVPLPLGYDSFRCSCPKPSCTRTYCPKTIQVEISCKNNLLWDARKTIMMLSVPNEVEFWKQKFSTPIGSRIMQLIRDSQKIRVKNFIDCETVEYKIIAKKKCPLITLSSMTIEDTMSEGTVFLPIHATENLAGTNVFLRFESAHGEIRLYKLRFVELLQKK